MIPLPIFPIPVSNPFSMPTATGNRRQVSYQLVDSFNNCTLSDKPSTEELLQTTRQKVQLIDGEITKLQRSDLPERSGLVSELEQIKNELLKIEEGNGTLQDDENPLWKHYFHHLAIAECNRRRTRMLGEMVEELWRRAVMLRREAELRQAVVVVCTRGVLPPSTSDSRLT